MNPQHPTAHRDTPAWIFFVWCQFAISIGMTGLGILYLPVDWWFKGYMVMGLFFCVAASITLSKTVRDNHESQRLINRVVDAKTEKILSEYELRKA